jgi:hypothetical protein
MTSYTPLLHLPEVASNQDQKEATINTAIAILEAAMNDTLIVSLASGNVTLNTDQFTKYFHHQFTGNTVARTVSVPNTPRWFAVENLGSATITFEVTGAPGLTAELASGKIGLVVSDGTDVRFVVPDPTGGVGLLQDLSNVSGVPTDGQLLRYVSADSNWEPWTLILAFSQLSDFPGSYASNPTKLLAVKADGTGLEWVSSAANVNSFIDLNDVPSSYSGAANKTVKVNSGATGLIFATPKLTEASDFPSSYTSAAGKFARVNSTPNALIFDDVHVADLLDGPGAPTAPNALKYVRINAAGTALEYGSGTGGPDHFFQLADVPGSYTGQANKLVRVKADETGLDFRTLKFTELSDAPSAYTGAGLKFVQVNSGGTALVFSQPKVSDLSDGPGAFTSNAKKVVRVNAGASALEYVSLALTDLAGFPTTFTGQGGKFLQVKVDESGIQFATSSFTTNFLALTDTPSSYSGQAGKMVVVDPTATGLIFVPQPAIPTRLGQLADVEDGTGTPVQGSFLRWIDGIWQADVFPVSGGSGSSTFAGLTDGPGPLSGHGLQLVRVKGDASKLEYFTLPMIPTTLGQLADVEDGTGTPAQGSFLRYVDGVWQAEPSSSVGIGGAVAFTGLSDVPHSYTSKGGFYVRVNGAANGLVFDAPPFIPHLLGQLADVEDGTGTPTQGDVLTWKDGVWQAEPSAAAGASSLAELTDVDETTPPIAGQMLGWNASTEKWMPYQMVWPGSHPFWRVKIKAGESSTVALAEVAFKESAFGTTMPGTPFAHNTASGSSADNAFDSNGATSWVTNAVDGDTYISASYDSPVRIRSVNLTSDATTAALGPASFDVEWSDTGSDWVLGWSATATGWGTSDSREFPFLVDSADEFELPFIRLDQLGDVSFSQPLAEGQTLSWQPSIDTAYGKWIATDPITNITQLGGTDLTFQGNADHLLALSDDEFNVQFSDVIGATLRTYPDTGTHAYWRLSITDINSSMPLVTKVGLAELQFREIPNGPAHAATGGTVISTTAASGTAAANVFDGDPATAFTGSAAPSGGSPVLIGYHFTSPVAVQEVYIQAIQTGFGGTIGAPPGVFDVQYSDDGSSWTTAFSANATGPDWEFDRAFVFHDTPTVSAPSFRTIQDVPHSYIGQAHKVVSVKADETGLEFTFPTGGGGSSNVEFLADLADVEAGTGTPVQGAFLRYIDGVWQADTPDVPTRATIDIVVSKNGLLFNSQVLATIPLTRAVWFQDDFAGSKFHCKTNPAATTVISVLKNGTQIGTVSISTSGVATFSTIASGEEAFVGGDTLRIDGPTSADAALADFGITFAAQRAA